MTVRRLCTFTVDGLLLGIDIEDVVEVLRDEVVTPVPLAPVGVVGMHNLRGRIVTAVDARRRLGLAPSDVASVSVVLRCGGEAVSLLVDREGEVVDVDESMAAPVPMTAAPSLRALVTHAYLVDGETVLVLDHDKTLSVASS